MPLISLFIQQTLPYLFLFLLPTAIPCAVAPVVSALPRSSFGYSWCPLAYGGHFLPLLTEPLLESWLLITLKLEHWGPSTKGCGSQPVVLVYHSLFFSSGQLSYDLRPTAIAALMDWSGGCTGQLLQG